MVRRALWLDDDAPVISGATVHESEKETFCGVYDPLGRPLHRQANTIGFDLSAIQTTPATPLGPRGQKRTRRVTFQR